MTALIVLVDTPLDVFLDSNGDLDFSVGGGPTLVAGVAGVAQLCRMSMLMFRGEWFLERTIGIPYYANDYVAATVALLEQKYDAGKVSSAYTLELLKVPGVAKVTSMSISFNNTTRVLSVAFEVLTTFGDTTNADVAIGA